MKKAILTLLMSMAFSYLYCANTKDMTKLRPSLYQTNRFGKITTPHNNKLKKAKGRKPFSLPLGKELYAWNGIKSRCLNKNNKAYKYYGGRGIKMCARWRNSYRNFLLDMGQAPDATYSIDRIDNNGNYEPGNCRWATMDTQANNRRNNIVIEYDGQTKTLSDWSRDLKFSYRAVHRLLKINKDLSPSQVLTDAIAPKSKLKIKKISMGPRYYHDLQSTRERYNLSPLGYGRI